MSSSSWKQIADYFGKGTRTVQRWRLEMGLPVHCERLRVCANEEELVAWVKSVQTTISPDLELPLLIERAGRLHRSVNRLRFVAQQLAQEQRKKKRVQPLPVAEKLRVSRSGSWKTLA